MSGGEPDLERLSAVRTEADLDARTRPWFTLEAPATDIFQTVAVLDAADDPDSDAP